jgi:hypothetical protein
MRLSSSGKIAGGVTVPAFDLMLSGHLVPQLFNANRRFRFPSSQQRRRAFSPRRHDGLLCRRSRAASNRRWSSLEKRSSSGQSSTITLESASATSTAEMSSFGREAVDVDARARSVCSSLFRREAVLRTIKEAPPPQTSSQVA